jgi:hypothetical protein
MSDLTGASRQESKKATDYTRNYKKKWMNERNGRFKQRRRKE